MMNENPAEGDLRVWYIPQIPMNAYMIDVPRRADVSEAAYFEQAAFSPGGLIPGLPIHMTAFQHGDHWSFSGPVCPGGLQCDRIPTIYT